MILLPAVVSSTYGENMFCTLVVWRFLANEDWLLLLVADGNSALPDRTAAAVLILSCLLMVAVMAIMVMLVMLWICC